MDRIDQLIDLKSKLPENFFSNKIDNLYIYSFETLSWEFYDRLKDFCIKICEEKFCIYAISISEKKQQFTVPVNSDTGEIILKLKIDDIDIFSIGKKIIIYGTTNDWAVVYLREVEWLIFGINQKLKISFTQTFLEGAEFESSRITDPKEPFDYNYGLAQRFISKDYEFIKALKKNYKFIYD